MSILFTLSFESIGEAMLIIPNVALIDPTYIQTTTKPCSTRWSWLHGPDPCHKDSTKFYVDC